MNYVRKYYFPTLGLHASDHVILCFSLWSKILRSFMGIEYTEENIVDRTNVHLEILFVKGRKSSEVAPW